MKNSDFAPGSFGAHEALHTASIVMDLVEERLLRHPTISDRPEWAELAETAHRALFDLYQAIGAEHLYDRRVARTMALKNLAEMSDEEDAAITADAEADSDNPPADELIARRGRAYD